MVSPTLLNVAIVTGLRPTESTFRFDMKPKANIELTFKTMTYSNFILRHDDRTTTNGFNEEHVAFFLLWLSAFFLCSKSLQVSQKFLIVALLLHEGSDGCLSKILLGEFYLFFSQVVDTLRKPPIQDRIPLFAGPFWFLQLWLNAIFESKLSTKPSQNVSRIIEAFRISHLTSKKDKINVETSFEEFYTYFSEISSNTPKLSPFISRLQGTEWKIQPFPCSSFGAQNKCIAI